MFFNIDLRKEDLVKKFIDNRRVYIALDTSVLHKLEKCFTGGRKFGCCIGIEEDIGIKKY